MSDVRETLRQKGYFRQPDGSYSQFENLPVIKHGPANNLPPAPKRVPVSAPESPLEARFLEIWMRLDGPELKREQVLIPNRRFRVDFLHEPSKVIFELQGFKDHTSWKGFARDNFKFLQLALLGYQVITLDKPLVTEENVRALIGLVNGKV